MRLRQFLSLPALLAALVVCVPCSFALAADTPLIEAVRGGSAAAVRMLLDKGADPGRGHRTGRRLSTGPRIWTTSRWRGC